MNRLITIMVATIAVLLATPAKAQLFLGNKMMGSQKVEGVVHFVNGTTEEYPQIEVPVTRDRDLTVYDQNKKKTRFNATEINYIDVWYKTTPDKHWYFAYLDCDYPMYKSIWASIVGVSENLIVYKVALGYGVNKKGELEYYVQDNMSSVAIMYYNRTTNSYFQQGFKTIKHFKEKFSAFFVNDPILRAKIESGEVGFRDWDFILDNYSPSAE